MISIEWSIMVYGLEKHISKCVERPEDTEKDVAGLDVLQNCACSFLQHEPRSIGENMLAASDVARIYPGHQINPSD